MRKTIKKISLLGAAVLLLCLIFSVAACSKNDTTLSKAEPTVFLAETSYSMLTNETLTLLPPEVTGLDEYTITYSSENTALATVSSDGIVTSKSIAGTVTITVAVTGTEWTGSIRITIIDEGEIPVLKLLNVQNNKLNLYSGQQYEILARVNYRNQPMADAVIEVSSRDDSIIDIDGMILFAVSSGETTITVSTEYLGTQLSEEIAVIVTVLHEKVSVSFDSGDVAGVSDPEMMSEIDSGSEITLPSALKSTDGSYIFGGWSDGFKIYDGDENYLVGSIDLAFTAVWYRKLNNLTIRSAAEVVLDEERIPDGETNSVKVTMSENIMRFRYDLTDIESSGKEYAYFSIYTDADTNARQLTVTVDSKTFILKDGWNRIVVTLADLQTVETTDSDITVVCEASSLNGVSFWLSDIYAADAFENQITALPLSSSSDRITANIETTTEKYYGNELGATKVSIVEWLFRFKFNTPIDTSEYNGVRFYIYTDYKVPAGEDTYKFKFGEPSTVYNTPEFSIDLVSGDWTEIEMSVEDFNASVNGEKIFEISNWGNHSNEVLYISSAYPVKIYESDITVVNRTTLDKQGVSSEIKYGDELGSTVLTAMNWDIQFRFNTLVSTQYTHVEFYVYADEIPEQSWSPYNKVLYIDYGTSSSATRLATITGEKTWSKVTLTVAQYNAIVNGDSAIQIENGDSLSGYSVYVSQAHPVDNSINGVVGIEANISQAISPIYGDDTVSTKLQPTGWRGTFRFVGEQLDATEYAAVKFWIYADTIPVGGYGLKVTLNSAWLGDELKESEKWYEMELTIAQYNSLVNGTAVIQLDDGNDVSSATFYISSLMFIGIGS